MDQELCHQIGYQAKYTGVLILVEMLRDALYR
jgi:hypothetical protein